MPGRAERGLWVLVATTLGGLVVWRAWVCDDAYISFRVVDNALHGYGLRWNVDERLRALVSFQGGRRAGGSP